MASIVQLKRSALSGKVPDTGSLNLGELAVNTYDGKIYFKKSGSIESVESVVTTNSVITGSIRLEGTGSFGSLKVNDTLTVNHGISVISGSLGITSDLTVLGQINARQFNISVISSSILFESGSSKFGNTSDDIHSFTGSVNITGSFLLNGEEVGGGTTTGSFTGSFTGDGSGLRGVVSDDIPRDGWDYNANSSASISDFNNTSDKYYIDFEQSQSTAVGTPIGFKGFLSNVSGSSQILPTLNSIDFVVGNNVVASIGASGIQATIPAGTVSGSSQLTSSYDTRYVLSGSITQTTWDNIANKPSGIVSQSTDLSSLNSKTGSYATTGSNLFNGDQTISGSIIPAVSGAYDLGSVINPWRHIYVNTGSIFLVKDAQIVKVLNTNTIVTTTDIASGSVNISPALPVGVVSGSSQITYANISSIPSGIVSGSSQITISSTTGFSTYSTSVDSRITTEKGRVDAILLAADADKDTFVEIVSLINSVDTSNDSTFAFFYTASVNRLNNLETTSGSVNISISNINTQTGSSNTRLTALEASASTALSTNGTQATSITNLNTITASLNTSVTNINTTTASLNTSVSNLNTATSSYETKGRGLVSGSSQITYASISSIPAGIVSGSSQVTYANISSIPSGIVSGSSQITLSSTTGYGSVLNQAVLTTSSPTFASITSNGNINIPGTNKIVFNNEPLSWFLQARTTSSTANLGSVLKNLIYNGGGANEGIAFSGVDTGAASMEVRNDGRVWIKENLIVGGTLTENSSIRYKENVETIKYGLDKILQMRGVTYDKKDNGVKEMGVIAEEVYDVLPEVVLKNEEGEIDSVSYGRIVGVLIEAIKEQQKQIEELKALIK